MKKFPTFSLSQAVPICLSKTIQLSKTFYKRKFATFLSFIAEKVSLCETAKWSKCDYSKQKFFFQCETFLCNGKSWLRSCAICLEHLF